MPVRKRMRGRRGEARGRVAVARDEHRFVRDDNHPDQERKGSPDPLVVPAELAGNRPVGTHRTPIPWRQAQAEAPHPADYTPCAICGGPYHPATGGLHWVEWSGREVAWCGPCERDTVKWFVAYSKGVNKRIKVDGKWVKIRFHDHAHPRKEE